METDLNDKLPAEYDLEKLRIRKVGPGRKHPDETAVYLSADVAEVFPDSESVNEALRFLIRITRENLPAAGEAEKRF